AAAHDHAAAVAAGRVAEPGSPGAPRLDARDAEAGRPAALPGDPRAAGRWRGTAGWRGGREGRHHVVAAPGAGRGWPAAARPAHPRRADLTGPGRPRDDGQLAGLDV